MEKPRSVNQSRQIDLSARGYRVIKEIGRGMFASAHLVSLLSSPREFYVAKCVDLEQLKDRDKRLAEQEVEVLKSMSHPNIVKLKESFLFTPFLLVMVVEYCEQGELRNAIRVKADQGEYFSEEEILRWFSQLVDALSYVHSFRVIHRDLKTSNIFLKRGRALLGDFGMSKVFEGSIQAAMTIVGTPFYMSPEICQNQLYNYKSDIWSLGCVLYELCALKHPFVADGILALVPKILNEKYPPIPDKYSPELKTLLSRLLAKKPEDRPSAADLLGDPLVTALLNSPAPPAPKAPEYSENVQWLLGKLKRRIELGKIDWLSLFLQFDLSGVGKLNISDFQTALLSLGLGLSEREAVLISLELGREFIRLDTLRLALENIPASALLAEGWARETLSGVSEPDELRDSPFMPEIDFREFLKQHKPILTDAEILKVLALADKSLAGEIIFDDFCQRYLQSVEIKSPTILIPRTPPRTPGARTPSRTPTRAAQANSQLIGKLRRSLRKRGLDARELFTSFSDSGRLGSDSVIRSLAAFPLGLSSAEAVSLNEGLRYVTDVNSLVSLLDQDDSILTTLSPGEANNWASEILKIWDASGWITESAMRQVVERVFGNNWNDTFTKQIFRDPEGRFDAVDLLERLGAAPPARPPMPGRPGQQPVNDETFVALVSRALFSLEELKINFSLISICQLRDVYNDGQVPALQASVSLWKAPLGLSQAEADALVSRLCGPGLGFFKVAEATNLINQVITPGSALFKVLKSQLIWIRDQIKGLQLPQDLPSDCSREQLLEILQKSGLTDPAKSRALLLFCDKANLFQPRKFFNRFRGNGRLLSLLSSN